MTGKKRWEWEAAALIVVLFLLAAGRELPLPGLWHDEANDASYGMELVLGLPRTATDWTASFGGAPWPLRVAHPYDFSAFSIYWSALFFRLFGVSVPVLRASALAAAAAGLAGFFAFARRWFGARAALAGCALLAAHPAFLIWSRVGYFAMEIFVLSFALPALALLSAWDRARRPWMLYAGCLLLGLSANVSTKALAFLLAAPAVYLAWAPRESRSAPKQAAAAFAALALGALNPLAFCASNAVIVRSLLEVFGAPTRAGVDNLALVENARARLSELRGVLDGSAATISVGTLPGAAALPAAAALAAAALALRTAATRDASERRRLGALLTLCAALFVETCFTPMALHAQHELVVLPFALLAVAAALDGAARLAPPRLRRAAGASAVAVLLGLLVAEARVDGVYFSELRRTGGVERWSDGFSEAGRYLDEHGIRRPICLSWGIAKNIYVLTAGRVAPLAYPVFRGRADAGLEALFKEAIRDPANRYLMFPDDIPNIGQRVGAVLAFKRTVRAAGKRLVLEKEFTERLGRPMLRLYRAS